LGSSFFFAFLKIFIRNENTDTWAAVKLWIAQFTDSPDDEISIALGTNAGVQSVKGVGTTYVSPDSKVHADVLNVGGLAQNAYKAI
jgi:hypothetical protein